MKVQAEMVAAVWKVLVSDGATVQEGDELIVLESMKMEIPITAPVGGIVRGLALGEGDVVQEGQELLIIEEAS